MLKLKFSIGLLAISFLALIGCQESDTSNNPIDNSNTSLLKRGATTANGWYEEEEIYYIDNGVEQGVPERGENQIYLVGGNRVYQANVVLFLPGEPGYSPHWNVNVIHTATGVTVSDILASPYASIHFNDEGVLFDDVEDILGAQQANLITVDHPGVVVNCPIVSEKAADAPGNTPLPEDFQSFDLNAGF